MDRMGPHFTASQPYCYTKNAGEEKLENTICGQEAAGCRALLPCPDLSWARAPWSIASVTAGHPMDYLPLGLLTRVVIM